MNFIGKTFIMLICAMSLLFMGIAITVYASHKNWRDVVMTPDTGLAATLGNQKEKNQTLQVARDKLNKDVEIEENAKRNALAMLEAEKEAVQNNRDKQRKDLAQINQEIRTTIASMQNIHEHLEQLRIQINGQDQAAGQEEIIGLKEKYETVRSDREAELEKVLKLTDDLHHVILELKALKARNMTLAADYAGALEILRVHNIEPNPNLEP